MVMGMGMVHGSHMITWLLQLKRKSPCMKNTLEASAMTSRGIHYSRQTSRLLTDCGTVNCHVCTQIGRLINWKTSRQRSTSMLSYIGMILFNPLLSSCLLFPAPPYRSLSLSLPTYHLFSTHHASPSLSLLSYNLRSGHPFFAYLPSSDYATTQAISQSPPAAHSTSHSAGPCSLGGLQASIAQYIQQHIGRCTMG